MLGQLGEVTVLTGTPPGERHYHVALPLIVAAGALAALALLINRTPFGAFAALLILAVVWVSLTPITALPQKP